MRALMLHRLPPCRRLTPPPRLSRPRARRLGAAPPPESSRACRALCRLVLAAGVLALGLASRAPCPGLGSPCAAYSLGSSRSWGRLGAAEPRLFTRRRPHERFQNKGPGGKWDFITLRWLSSRMGLTPALAA